MEAGQRYVDGASVSKKGLIRALSSKRRARAAGLSVHSKADATFAANNVDADWNDEAVEAARNYLSSRSWSKGGLIEQLSEGDSFTPAQARLAVNKVL